jgi:transcriptional regulator with XRE-family HTH domain
LLNPPGFFKRVCEALNVPPGRGAKAKVAKILGISKSSAGFWEEGKMPGMSGLENVAHVSKLSGASLHWLLTGEGQKYVRDISEYSLEDLWKQLSTLIHELPEAKRESLILRLIADLISEVEIQKKSKGHGFSDVSPVLMKIAASKIRRPRTISKEEPKDE